MIEIYEAVCLGTDGRDCRSIGWFTTKKAATEAAKGRGAMGYGDGTVEGPKVLYESFQDYLENNPNIRRQKALLKLTEEDKKALGLKP